MDNSGETVYQRLFKAKQEVEALGLVVVCVVGTTTAGCSKRSEESSTVTRAAWL